MVTVCSLLPRMSHVQLAEKPRLSRPTGLWRVPCTSESTAGGDSQAAKERVGSLAAQAGLELWSGPDLVRDTLYATHEHPRVCVYVPLQEQERQHRGIQGASEPSRDIFRETNFWLDIR